MAEVKASSRQRRSYGANDQNSVDPAEWPPTKAALYESALELFWTKGFDSTSVQEIVDHAGLTKGALYHYFDSKDGLLRLITERSFDVTVVEARTIVEQAASSAEALHGIILHTLQSIETYRREIGLFFEQWRKRGTDALPGTQRRRSEYEAVVIEVVERGMADGEFEDVADPRLIAFAIMGMTTHALNWWRPNDPLDAEQLASIYSALVVKGLDPR